MKNMQFDDSMNGDEFLTFNEEAETLTEENINQTTADDLEPLHTLEEVPSVKDQKPIKMGADTKVMKQMARDDLISSDISKIRNKMAAVPKSPLDSLKELIAKGSFTKEFDLFGHKWQLRSLDQADYIQIFDESDAMAETSGRFESLKLVSIAYSIEALDGISVYSWFPDDITLEKYKNDRQAFSIAIRRAVRRYLEVSARSLLNTLYEKVQEIEVLQKQTLDELKN